MTRKRQNRDRSLFIIEELVYEAGIEPARDRPLGILSPKSCVPLILPFLNVMFYIYDYGA
jgi:hypothetical protein